MTDDEQTRAARLLEIQQRVHDAEFGYAVLKVEETRELLNLCNELLAELTAAEAERDRLRERISDLELTLKLTLAGEDD